MITYLRQLRAHRAYRRALDPRPPAGFFAMFGVGCALVIVAFWGWVVLAVVR
jgi:hypothetical protein